MWYPKLSPTGRFEWWECPPGVPNHRSGRPLGTIGVVGTSPTQCLSFILGRPLCIGGILKRNTKMFATWKRPQPLFLFYSAPVFIMCVLFVCVYFIFNVQSPTKILPRKANWNTVKPPCVPCLGMQCSCILFVCLCVLCLCVWVCVCVWVCKCTSVAYGLDCKSPYTSIAWRSLCVNVRLSLLT